MSWLDPADFDAVLEASTPATSMLHTRPWRFRMGPAEIDLLADADRQLPAAGASGWAAWGWAARLACGVALFNLRVALAVRERPATVRLQPDRTDPDLLARLTADVPRLPTPIELRLYRAIARQYSDRTPFADRPVPVEVRAELLAAARAEQAWLDLLIGPAAVQATAGLVQTAHELLDGDAGYRADVWREMSQWRSAAPAAAHPMPVDGVPARAASTAPRPYRLPPRWDFRGAVSPGGLPGELPCELPSGLPSRREFQREPLMAVLGGSGDWPADQVQAGQALQRVLLTATDLGLAASMYSQPIEAASVREQLRLALGRHAAPQMLIRFGYPTPAPPNPRWAVADRVVG